MLTQVHDPTTVTQRVFYRAMREAGFLGSARLGQKRTFHALLHTFAKRALEVGGPDPGSAEEQALGSWPKPETC